MGVKDKGVVTGCECGDEVTWNSYRVAVILFVRYLVMVEWVRRVSAFTAILRNCKSLKVKEVIMGNAYEMRCRILL